MEDYEFKFFKGIAHKSQPDLSNWCWAACISKLIQGFRITTNIENNQCSIAGYYLKTYHKSNGKSISKCCHDGTINETCNLGLLEKDLESVFSDFGIRCDRIPSNKLVSSLSNYDFVVENINNSKFPILVQIEKPNGTHLIMLSGYGYYKKCKYVLIGDPLRGAEYYQLLKNFINNEKILKAWTCSLDLSTFDHTTLIKDDVLHNYLSLATIQINRLLGDLTKRKQDDLIPHTNPIGLLQNEFVPNFVQEFKTNTDLTVDRSILNTLKNISKFSNECYPEIPRNSFTLLPIIENVNELRAGFRLPSEEYEYFEDYATHAEKRTDSNGGEKLRALSFPQNYHLSKESFLSRNEFMRQLQKNKMITYFQ